MATIEIPIENNPDEVIEINFSQLPQMHDVKMILLSEKTRLRDWITVAIEYYKCNRTEDFIHLLECSGREANVGYPESQADQLRALDTLAAHYLMMAQKQRKQESRGEFLSKATMLYATADSIHMFEKYHLLGRAYFCLLEGTKQKVEQADAQFCFVLDKVSFFTLNIHCLHRERFQDPNNVPAILGRAAIMYKRGDYIGALSMYRKALRAAPNCPSEVRLGLAYCFFKLGQLEKTGLALQRALQLKPDNVDALVGLAVFELNRGRSEDIRIGVQRLTIAYQLDGNHPIALIALADHFFFKKVMRFLRTALHLTLLLTQDPENCKVLAMHAFHVTENDGLRAQACFQLARALHDQGELIQAYQFYYQSTLFDKPNYVLPYYGLGQVYIMRGEMEKAIVCFEKVIDQQPDSFEAMKVLGSLYAASDKKERKSKAKEYLAKVVEMFPDDVNALIEYASVLQEKETDVPNKQPLCPTLQTFTFVLQLAIEMYNRACKIYKQMNETEIESPELWNNLGSLYFRAKRYTDAEVGHLGDITCFKRAVDTAVKKMPTNEPYFKSILVTVSYNLGRLSEVTYDMEQAEKIYKDILMEHPQYTDCYLRLGCMARDRGQIYDASVWFKEALQFNQGHPDAWTLIGNLHLSKKEWGPAQKKFERILRQSASSLDSYSLVALGNIWLLSMQQNWHDEEKAYRSRNRALSIYRRALSVSAENVYACNGIGCILAHLYYVDEAMEIFARVREVLVTYPDVWLNMAHLYAEQRQNTAAVLMYENAIKKFGFENNVEVLVYLARAYFRADKMMESKNVLLKARYLAPFDPLILYNLALTLKVVAMRTLQNTNSYLKEVLSAVKDLKQAEKYFAILSHDTFEHVVDIGRATVLREKCGEALAQASHHVRRAQELENTIQAVRREQEETRRLAQERRRQMQIEKEEAAKRIQKEQMERRMIFVERTRQLLSAPDLEAEKAKKSNKGKRKQNDDSFLNDDSDLGYSPGSKKTKNKRKRKGRRSMREKDISASMEGSDSGTLEKGPSTPSRKKKKAASSSRRSTAKATIKSREILSSTSSSDEDDKIPCSR
ncbi:RNA polymerase associated protein CTR9 [Trichuris trichiura]|uniref:RNA polymerase associated protein CTR9 n=1 Tax=Trichuris trichiura TaxID=36087 RepID=A0A077ZEE6_TRITR|nr:RNA polymerase associated protein CTR9 [Trichuris trichiura]